MIVIGITGSIGMGKSTASGMLARQRLAVFDADRAAHCALHETGAGRQSILKAFPRKVYPRIYSGAAHGGEHINRRELAALVFSDDSKRELLEDILHPQVEKALREFLALHRRRACRAVALDVPLLYETGMDRMCDYVAVVTAPLFLQRRRVLARSGMGESVFAAALRRQMPDAEKRRRADFIIHAGLGFGVMQRDIKFMLDEIGVKGEPGPPCPSIFPEERDKYESGNSC